MLSALDKTKFNLEQLGDFFEGNLEKQIVGLIILNELLLEIKFNENKIYTIKENRTVCFKWINLLLINYKYNIEND